MDEFWSISLLHGKNHSESLEQQEQQHQQLQRANEWNECSSVITTRFLSILPPHRTSLEPLTLQLHLNCNEGVFSDISAIPWDASYLLAGYLYGTLEGRRLCHDACHGGGGGILELGSGLGIVGMAAAAASLALGNDTGTHCTDFRNSTPEYRDNQSINDSIIQRGFSCTCMNRVVMTDLNDDEILSHLKRNVDANLAVILGGNSRSDNSQTSHERMASCCISVQPCDWTQVSSHHQTKLPRKQSPVANALISTEKHFPSGPFCLIIGSALIYLPQHAAACADTLYFYLTNDDDMNDMIKESSLVEIKQQRQAILAQLPDRCGFATHFLPRCHELGLEVLCKEFEEELIEKVEAGLGNSIPSVREYRMYFIRIKREPFS